MVISSWLRTFSPNPGSRFRRSSLNRRRRAQDTDFAVAVESLEQRTLLSAFTVNTTVDSVDINPGDGLAEDAAGNTSLRAAIMEANALVGADTIGIGAGLYELSIAGTLDNASTSGDLDITDDLTITGAGQAVTTIDGGALDRVFDVHAGAIVAFSDLTIRNGSASDLVIFAGPMTGGGGIRNAGDLTITSTTITDNSALLAGSGDGGGILSAGVLTVNDSIISNNVTIDNGGGIRTRSSAITTITGTTITGNTASQGGGLELSSSLDVTTTTIVDSLISDNSSVGESVSAGLGGGVYLRAGATAEIIGSTIIGNTATAGGDGGGVGIQGGNLTISHSTIADNLAEGGGGGILLLQNGSLTVSDSTIAENHAGAGGGGAILHSDLLSGMPVTSITRSTISGNTTDGFGGGVLNFAGDVTIHSSTVSGNAAALAAAGGLGEAGSSLTVLHSTLANNAAGGEPNDFSSVGGATVNIGHTIVASGVATSVLPTSTINSLGYNLFADSTGVIGLDPTDIVDVDPLLGPLQDNGGPTETHALLPGSPALDAGDPSFSPPPDFDQRGPGFARVVNGRIDIGALEVFSLTIDGRVFDDLDNDGAFNGSDIGLSGVTVTLIGTDDLGAVSRNTVTLADGTYTFDNVRPGTYTLSAEQAAGLLDGSETAGSLGGTVDNTQDSNTISDIVVAGSDPDATGYNFAEIQPSDALGLVWQDFNNDGEVNFGEQAVQDVTVNLTGTDDRGNAVNESVLTDVDGIYMFADLRPSDSAGYTISEVQPAGLNDGLDVVGTVNGVTTGVISANDVISGVVLAQPGSLAENYNFGERPEDGGEVVAGQTATIGFWQNNNGQDLIEALNGGATSTQLGDWLAATFPNMYGANAGANDLTSASNSDVADFYSDLFRRKKKEAVQLGLGGPTKMDAQVFATALAVYVTNSTLAGTTAEGYGFVVTEDGVGVSTFNVGDNGDAFDVADGSEVSVLDLLLTVNDKSEDGVLFDLDGDGDADDSLETLLRTMANDVFSGINEQGDI